MDSHYQESPHFAPALCREELPPKPPEPVISYFDQGPSLVYDGNYIVNGDNHPYIMRISLKEILTQYETIVTTATDLPAEWKLAPFEGEDELKDLFLGTSDWKEVPSEKIKWGESLPPMPEGLHIFLRTKSDTLTYALRSYIDVKDDAGNLLGHQMVSLTMDPTWDDAETLRTLQAVDPPKYRYYLDDADAMKVTKTQWSDMNGEHMLSEDVEWQADSAWLTARPTLEQLVYDWDEAVPRIVLQSGSHLNHINDAEKYGLLLKAPYLTKEPTPKRWFYNEADGYFYYIGIMQPGTVMYSLFGASFPEYQQTLFTDYVKSVRYRTCDEAILDDKEAAAALWGLTFEPGSLGAMILGN